MSPSPSEDTHRTPEVGSPLWANTTAYTVYGDCMGCVLVDGQGVTRVVHNNSSEESEVPICRLRSKRRQCQQAMAEWYLDVEAVEEDEEDKEDLQEDNIIGNSSAFNVTDCTLLS